MDIPPHRSWMYNMTYTARGGLRPEYIDGVKGFIEYAKTLTDFVNDKLIRCPCRKCVISCKLAPEEDVHMHLLTNGFKPNYWYWTDHKEVKPNIISAEQQDREDPLKKYSDMVCDAARQELGDEFQYFDYEHNTNDGLPGEQDPNPEASRFYELLNQYNKPLFSGCKSLSPLSVAMRIMSIKTNWNVAQEAIDEVFKLLWLTLPEDHICPKNYYEAKKLLSMLGLVREKIDCCVNGCMLYYKDDVELQACKFCTAPRYKRRATRKGNQAKDLAEKSMHYLPIIPRLKRLYASMSSAPHMIWHHENRREDGIMCHPSHGMAWKEFDRAHVRFAKDPRNVRLGLCSDGFNPFSQSAAPYSCWPVIITPYNLPPQMCMTAPYMFLVCMIPGKKNPKAMIDIYLQPLIDELKLLWGEGVSTYDTSTKMNFRMRAALMWTVNDFPAYGMLSGWMTAGKLACPYCMDSTKSFYLKHGRKNCWFDCHRRFLDQSHPYRSNTNNFMKNQAERDPPPKKLSSLEIWQTVSQLPKVTDQGPLKRFPGYGKTHNWTKQSIFWELPYWKDNLLRHNLDVMHIEKNFFDNIFNTVMDVKGKTKDNEKSRLDLQLHCRRSELHLRQTGNMKWVKPKAKYTLSQAQVKDVCQWIRGLHLPDGYSSNLSRLVDQFDGKFYGWKSHDCHIFMEQLLPIGFKELPDHVWKPLAELSKFFKDLCSTTLRNDDLDRMEQNISVILCKLERIFPPSFFDVIEHLPIHLIDEARRGGPVQFRWMYPFKRFLGKLKRTVRQKAQVEGSICEAFICRETINFCSFYFETNILTSRTRVPRNDDGGLDRSIPETLSIFNKPGQPGAGKSSTRYLTDVEYDAARLHVLLNCEEIKPYIEHFVDLNKIHPDDRDTLIARDFPDWFEYFMDNPINHGANLHLQNLARGPKREVKTWQQYLVNGFKFDTEEYNHGKSTYNSGVWVQGDTGANDIKDYYGILKHIIELEYFGLPIKKVVLFYCEWFDPSHQGTRVGEREYNIVEIHARRRYPTYDPFIVAQQCRQVYFAAYPGNNRAKGDWRAIIKTKAIGRVELPDFLEVAYQNDEYEHVIRTNVDVTEPLLVDSVAFEEVDVNVLEEAVRFSVVEVNTEHDDDDDDHEDEYNEEDETDKVESPSSNEDKE